VMGLGMQQAHSLFELKAHGGVNLTNPDLPVSLDVAPLLALGGDVVFNLPLVPFGFGLRYEHIGIKMDENIGGQDVDFEIKSQRVSAVVNKRLWDLFLAIGVVGTVTLYQSNSIRLIEGATIHYDEAPDNKLGYSLGVEAGAKLIGWIVGGEVGYQSNQLESDGLDFSGMYAKVMVGFGF